MGERDEPQTIGGVPKDEAVARLRTWWGAKPLAEREEISQRFAARLAFRRKYGFTRAPADGEGI